MYTPRKKHLRKKRNFLHKQNNFVLFNASNLKTAKVEDIKLSLQNAKLYWVPLYLKPPKLGLGYPMIIIIYDNLKDLKTNVPDISKKIDCIGVCIDKKWYPINFLKSNNIINQKKKVLSLLLYKNKKI